MPKAPAHAVQPTFRASQEATPSFGSPKLPGSLRRSHEVRALCLLHGRRPCRENSKLLLYYK